MDVSMLLLLIAIILIIAGVIYYFIYKSVINKKLENGDYEMKNNKKRMPSDGSVMAFILSIIVIVGYINVNNKLNNLTSELSRANYNIGYLDSRIDGLQNMINNLEEELNMQDSDVFYLRYSFGQYYEEDHTADVIFILSPKHYTKSDIVSLYIYNWNQMVDLNLTSEGTFKGTIRTDIFNFVPDEVEYTIGGDARYERGKVQPENEMGGTCMDIWSYYLIYPKYNIQSPVYEYSDGKLSYEVQGEIIPENLSGMDVSGLVESVKIITKLDDKVIDEYETVTENHAFKLRETRDVRIDQRLEIYAEITDKYGFIYRFPIVGWIEGTRCEYSDCMKIYDKEGNLLTNAYL